MGWEEKIKFLWVVSAINLLFGMMAAFDGKDTGAYIAGNFVICAIIMAVGVICKEIDSLKVK